MIFLSSFKSPSLWSFHSFTIWIFSFRKFVQNKDCTMMSISQKISLTEQFQCIAFFLKTNIKSCVEMMHLNLTNLFTTNITLQPT